MLHLALAILCAPWQHWLHRDPSAERREIALEMAAWGDTLDNTDEDQCTEVLTRISTRLLQLAANLEAVQ